MSLVIRPEEVEPIVGGLMVGIDVDGGPTDEQLKVLRSLLSNLWKRSDLGLNGIAPLSPRDTVTALQRPKVRLPFCELLMSLELCRYRQSLKQVERVEAYVSAMGPSDIEIRNDSRNAQRGADETSKDLERSYAGILTEISEVSFGITT